MFWKQKKIKERVWWGICQKGMRCMYKSRCVWNSLLVTETGFWVVPLGPGRKVNSLLAYSRYVILHRWLKNSSTRSKSPFDSLNLIKVRNGSQTSVSGCFILLFTMQCHYTTWGRGREVFLGSQVSIGPSLLGFPRRHVRITHLLGIPTQITLNRGSGARHYGIPNVHYTQAPDYPGNGWGLRPLGYGMQSKATHNTIMYNIRKQ